MESSNLVILEERVQALLNTCKGLMDENRSLRDEVEGLRQKINDLEGELAMLRQERSLVKDRVGALIELIDAAGIAGGERGPATPDGGQLTEHPLLASVAGEGE